MCLYAALMLGVLGVTQAAPSISDGSRLYAPCAVCHQPSAWGSPDGVIPNIAGQQKRYLEEQLTLFRSESREDTAMKLVTVHSTFDDQRSIVAVADYLSSLDANPSPVTGAGDHLQVGQELYVHICAACHGDSGQGQRESRAPRIGGQHYPYLRQQIERASDSHKELAPPEMLSAFRSMRPQEKDALADYISRMGRSDVEIQSKRSDQARPNRIWVASKIPSSGITGAH